MTINVLSTKGKEEIWIHALCNKYSPLAILENVGIILEKEILFV